MPKRTGTVARATLAAAPLPAATETYTVISHSSIIDHTLKTLTDKGFQLISEIYKSNGDAQVAQGIFKLQYGSDPELGMMFAFANSYDKSMRFKCAIGAYVHANDAAMISGNMMSWGRKHTGVADELAAEMIEKQFENAEDYFKQLVEDKEAMKGIVLSKRQFAELLGVLYIELGIITGEQLGVIKNEYKRPSFTYNTGDNSLWTLYNHILVALKKSHPKNWMDQQKVIHFHLCTEFNLAAFDPEPEEVADDTTIDASTELVEESAEEVSEVINPVVVKEEVNPTTESKLEATPILPGYGTLEEPKIEVAETTSSPEEAIIETEVFSEFTLEDAPDESLTRAIVQPKESDIIFMSKTDVMSLNSEAAVGEFLLIMDEPYEIISESSENGITGFYLKPATVEEDSPVDGIAIPEAEVIPIKAPAGLISMKQSEVFALYPEAFIGDSVEIEGVTLHIEDVEEDTFLMTPLSASPEASVVKNEEPVIAPAAEVVESNPIIIEEIEEHPIMEVPESPTTNKDDALRAVISQELFDLYGTIPEYTYELRNDQYNVTLNTEEVVVLMQYEIDSRL